MVESLCYQGRHSVGNEAIDEDHHLIFGLLHEFRGALDGNELAMGKAYVADIARALGDHFRREEAILDRCLAAGAEDHAARHRELRRAAEDVLAEVAEMVTPDSLSRAYHRLANIVMSEVLDADFLIASQCATPVAPPPDLATWWVACPDWRL